ncbi:hypothetical protein D0Z70_07855 [Sphingobium terrigena]|uniref:Uncharacterized protein n=1 Tax=Sphingobium terrigena TaxID=2304063 RepID=A0A418YUU4_9SPHN|nr:hypothetical protein [Sphingobium terrigena]RJG55934.1 hypothetical protein D0Z70_07855 [Sphingobium terrigena]
MSDLFGDGQFSLFGETGDRMSNPQQASMVPDPDQVRQRLHALLDTARNARTMPWTEKKARVWQIVFPNMANWLPEAEADQLRFEFSREIERLKKAA